MIKADRGGRPCLAGQVRLWALAVALCVTAGAGSPALGDVSISVNPTQVIREVDPFFYGANMEWLDMGSGLVDPATGALDATLLDLMRPLGFGSFRFLGNDFYRWQAAVGPIGQRGDNYNPYAGANEPCVLGPEEFVGVCAALGAQGIVSVNAGTADAAEAASWVRYTNLTLQKPVKWWEIGNEPYFYRPGATPFDQVYQTPEQYAAEVREYAQAMKAVDPTIRVGVGVWVDTGNYPALYHADWNQRVLPAVADIIDFVSVHNGYAPLTEDGIDMGNPQQRSRAYSALLAAPDWVAENVRQIRGLLDQTAGSRANLIAISITEYAPIFGAATLADVDQTRTLACALYVADLLRAYLAEPSVATAQYMPAIHRWFGAPIRNGYDERVLSPVYSVFELFAAHFGRKLVAASVTGSPTYSIEATGIVPERTNAPYITAQASVSTAGDQLYVMAVNKHEASAQQAVISVQGQSSIPSAQAWTLTGPAMNSINGPSLTDTTVTADPPIALASLQVQTSGGAAIVALPPRSVTAVVIGTQPSQSNCAYAPDAQAPAAPSISINGGASSTRSRSVVLSVSASGAAEMRFKNENLSWSAWQPYAAQKTWTLSSGYGTKTVWLQCRDACGYMSQQASDTISYTWKRR